MNQSTLNGLIRNPYRWSPYLPALSRALETTVEYLVGETDDPDDKALAPPPPPAVHHVMLAVALPPERALARMFDVMLEALPPELGRQEQARLLAEWLPASLGQLKDLLPPLAANASRTMVDADYGSQS